MQYQGQKASGRLFVVKGGGPSLLRPDLLKKIRLNWGEIGHVRTVKILAQ